MHQHCQSCSLPGPDLPALPHPVLPHSASTLLSFALLHTTFPSTCHSFHRHAGQGFDFLLGQDGVLSQCALWYVYSSLCQWSGCSTSKEAQQNCASTLSMFTQNLLPQTTLAREDDLDMPLGKFLSLPRAGPETSFKLKSNEKISQAAPEHACR